MRLIFGFLIDDIGKRVSFQISGRPLNEIVKPKIGLKLAFRFFDH